MPRTLVRTLLGLFLVLVAATALILALRWPSFSEQEIRETIFTAIERESPEAFVVTGSLEITVTSVIEDSRVLLPGFLGLNLGTSRATVRVPGRVSYGFAADSLRPEGVRLTETGVIEVTLPPLEIYSTEPDLTRLEVETTRGWARLPETGEEVERRAIAVVEGALRRQGQSRLSSSNQPAINTARALERLLRPALRGLGMANPQFRFRLGEGLVVEPSG